MTRGYRAIAEYYDAEYEHHPVLQNDVPFFLGHLPSRKSQRVLDIACGTGRSCIPVAQAGHLVTGIDYDQPMLDIAARKRDFVGIKPSQLRLVCADATKFDLTKDRPFDWATVFFNTFLNFTTLSRQDKLLRNIHRHLEPVRGRLWIDIFQPNLAILAHPESKDHDPSIFYVPALQRTVQRTVDVRRDPSKQLQRITFNYSWFDKLGRERRESREFDLTFIFPREFRLLLERNGFRVEALYGNYEGGVINADSPRMIALARRD